jgi:hypothetical protein
MFPQGTTRTGLSCLAFSFRPSPQYARGPELFTARPNVPGTMKLPSQLAPFRNQVFSYGAIKLLALKLTTDGSVTPTLNGIRT